MKAGAMDYLTDAEMETADFGRIFQRVVERRYLVDQNMELRQVNQMKNEFIANVSHELRTPATAIAGYAETLLGDRADMDPTTAEMVETIHRNAQRLTALFDDLLLLAKLDAGPAQLPVEAVTLEPVVDDVIDRMQAKAEQRGISIQKMLPPGIQAMANRDALRHVIGNLIENGIKYSYDNGLVTVRVRPRDDARVLIEVIDVGMGIGPEHHERIFERFYRVDKGRARSAGGTGLGLSIVKRLVVGMGGELELRSQRGRGSVFRVFLDAAT
jgi:two-component system phosphate regulon sensor histidine kinase PhoR